VFLNVAEQPAVVVLSNDGRRINQPDATVHQPIEAALGMAIAAPAHLRRVDADQPDVDAIHQGTVSPSTT
jgi:hypothetical protein